MADVSLLRRMGREIIPARSALACIEAGAGSDVTGLGSPRKALAVPGYCGRGFLAALVFLQWNTLRFIQVPLLERNSRMERMAMAGIGAPSGQLQ